MHAHHRGTLLLNMCGCVPMARSELRPPVEIPTADLPGLDVF